MFTVRCAPDGFIGQLPWVAHCSCPIYLTMSRTTNVIGWSRHFDFVSGRNVGLVYKNIARGTTDPEIDSMTLIKFSNNMTPLALVGANCNSFKFGHQMAPLELVANMATRWRHLHKLQSWPPDGATCISWHISLNCPIDIIS